MTNSTPLWSDDEDEAPAPAAYADEPAEVEEDDDIIAPPIPRDSEADEESVDGGVSDAKRIVRVWVTDGKLTKVRISPNWAVKLERRKNQSSLGEVVSAVLQVAHLGVARTQHLPNPEDYEVELTPEFKRSLPGLSMSSLNRMHELYEELRQRVRANAEGNRQLSAPAEPTVGRVKGVTVVLNPHGHATRVDFDPKWLDQAHAGAISQGIMEAANVAYSEYQPTVQDKSDTLETYREYDYMNKVMVAIATPKDRR